MKRNIDRCSPIEGFDGLGSALDHINRAIGRISAQEELFRSVCELLVEHGGFRMARIKWRDSDDRTLVPLAQSGDQGDLQSIPLSSDDRPDGDGPSSIAFREGRPRICNDVLEDPAGVPWRAEIARRGYQAFAVFPIRVNGEVRGTLDVFAEDRGFFRDKEVALLAHTTLGLSLALSPPARRERRSSGDGASPSGGRSAPADEVIIQAIADREKHFAINLVEAMPGIFYLYDEQGRFLRWNHNFEKVSGYSGDEIARMRPLDFFTGPDQRLLQERITEVFEKGESSVEASFMAKDGSAIPYFFTGRRILFGGAACLVGVGVDITERKRAEDALSKSEGRYRTTLDNILEGCQLLGHDWHYLYLNDAAAIHNRRPNTELLGKRMPDAWPGIEATRIFALLRRCMVERVALHEETEFVFPDGSTGWFDVRSQPVPEGIFVLSIDISERKQAEKALRDLNEGLERKVADRTIELEAARVRAESADRIKSAFLATMSHELRTPLNSIIGFTGMVLQGLAGPLNPEQSKQLGMVRGSARHLLELINDVLDISKIEAGQLEVRVAPFDLGASVERVAASVKPLMEKKGLTLEVTLPASLDALESDRRRVDQILLNLLQNAIKFTDRGGVTLAVEAVGDGHSSGDDAARPAVRIRVSDTGIGMHTADLAKLFQPFRQIDSGLGRQHEGTGLGLAICRRLTELLGGTIGAESVWGQGSTFTVTLPQKRAGREP